MITGIILAAGKGTRINSREVNKVVLPFLGKPIIKYGVDLFSEITNPLVIVVGAFAESVQKVLSNDAVLYAHQEKQVGTSDAVWQGLKQLASYTPQLVLVGYGDHMMFYKKQTIKDLIQKHREEKASMSVITTLYDNPTGYGRIVRNKEGYVVDCIEEKDATNDQKHIKEINSGLYCFDYPFIYENIPHIKPSPVTGEYYLTDLIKIAAEQQKKIVGFQVPFEEVGIGINKEQELTQSQKLYLENH